jgi:hypothetical protein
MYCSLLALLLWLPCSAKKVAARIFVKTSPHPIGDGYEDRGLRSTTSELERLPAFDGFLVVSRRNPDFKRIADLRHQKMPSENIGR